MVLHWRFYSDPPEFFTCLHGDSDGEHWGMLLDEPTRGFRGVAAYFNNDGDDLRVYGGLFDAVLQRAEQQIEGIQENIEYDPGEREHYERELVAARRFEGELRQFIEGNGLAIDEDRGEGIPSCTCLDVIVPPDQYEPLSVPDDSVVGVMDDEPTMARLVREALSAVERGRPGAALQLGRALHFMGGKRRSPDAHRLLRAAYLALDRTFLAHAVDAHYANRDRRSVDIFRG